jgi:hypothetical protein
MECSAWGLRSERSSDPWNRNGDNKVDSCSYCGAMLLIFP